VGVREWLRMEQLRFFRDGIFKLVAGWGKNFKIIVVYGDE